MEQELKRKFLNTHYLKLQNFAPLIHNGMALFLGLATAFGVWLFKSLIDWTHALAFDQVGAYLARFGGWTVFILPVIGGLIVGLLMYFFVGPERHHGVAGIMEAVALAGGRLRYWRVPVKAVAAALSIGSGASVGPEDPSVQIGANLGSMLGDRLHLADDRVRSLVAAGAAAGIAAAFNAPIAGVFFALEIVLGEVSGSALGTVVLASVISAALTQALAGPEPAFSVPAYTFGTYWELLLYLGLGLIAGPVAALYIRGLYRAQDFFHHWAAPAWIKPAAAGLVVGVVGIMLPQIFGVGYDTIDQLLNGQNFGLGLLLILVLAKLVMTSISIGGGFPGGVFAPSLFLGAALGGAYGVILERLFPGLGLTTPAFAMVGMAAVLAGTVHSPLTAIILLFEMTRDYRIILPLMFAVIVSMLISQAFQRDSVYVHGLALKGIRLERGRDVEVLDTITVGDVMLKNPDTLRESDPLEKAAKLFAETHHHGMAVLNEAGEFVGIMTIGDMDRAVKEGKAETVGDACVRNPLVAYPDEPLSVAIRRMGVRDVGRLPVVSRDNEHELLGSLRRSAIIRAYDAALTQREIMRHKVHQVRLGSFSGAAVSEVVIEAGSPCDSRRIRDITWPTNCVIATIRRGRQTLIPRGDTTLRAGDVLVSVLGEEGGEALSKLCGRQETPQNNGKAKESA